MGHVSLLLTVHIILLPFQVVVLLLLSLPHGYPFPKNFWMASTSFKAADHYDYLLGVIKKTCFSCVEDAVRKMSSHGPFGAKDPILPSSTFFPAEKQEVVCGQRSVAQGRGSC